MKNELNWIELLNVDGSRYWEALTSKWKYTISCPGENGYYVSRSFTKDEMCVGAGVYVGSLAERCDTVERGKEQCRRWHIERYGDTDLDDFPEYFAVAGRSGLAILAHRPFHAYTVAVRYAHDFAAEFRIHDARAIEGIRKWGDTYAVQLINEHESVASHGFLVSEVTEIRMDAEPTTGGAWYTYEYVEKPWISECADH